MISAVTAVTVAYIVIRPEPDIQIGNLSTSADKVAEDNHIVVGVSVSNVGGVDGSRRIPLKLNGTPFMVKEVELESGENKVVNYVVRNLDSGIYELSAGGFSRIIQVEKSSKILVRNLRVFPRTVGPGDPVRISVDLKNAGESKGVRNLKLRVDGSVEELKRIVLNPKEKIGVVFNLAKQSSKLCTIEVDGLFDNFRVLKPAKLEFSNLAVNPSRVAPGKSLEVSVDIKNTGELGGKREVKLEIDGTVEDKLLIFLENGESKTVSFQIQRKKAKSYSIKFGDLSGSFSVLAPANFEVNNLDISPTEVLSGETVKVSADVKNVGEMRGEHEVKLVVEGAVDKVKEIQLDAGIQTTVSFNVQREEVRTYTVEVGNLFRNFRILEPAIFEYADLDVVPSKVGPGENVFISVRIKNTGEVEGRELVELKFENSVEDAKEILLAPDEIRSVSFISKREECRGYSVSVGGLFKNFEVLEPPKFKLENLEVHPRAAEPEEDVTVSLDVKNTGGLRGICELKLKIDDNVEKILDLELAGGEKDFVTFITKREAAGSYKVEVNGLSDNFRVLKPASFYFSDLRIDPAEVESGENATVIVYVKNEGEMGGTHMVKLESNGEVKEIREISLEPDEEEILTFILSEDSPGTYLVKIENLSGTFDVLRPAEFLVDNLHVDPERAAVGDDVHISADVKNIGEVEGDYEIGLMIDGVLEKIENISLAPNENICVSFGYTGENSKIYSVEVDGLTDTFELLEPAKFEFSDLTLTPSSAEAGDNVEISIDIKNVGEMEGKHTVQLKIDEEIKSTRVINLDGGEETTETFNIIKDPALENLYFSFEGDISTIIFT